MRVVTFYSYKGGVGRTLAAVNYALYLRGLRRKVVLIDFDLEAPGIDSKFLIDLSADQLGIVDYIVEYQETLRVPNIGKFSVNVPGSEGMPPMVLIPSGAYLEDRYFMSVHKINWDSLFSERLMGAAFFQQLLESISSSVFSGLCHYRLTDQRSGRRYHRLPRTQQLADEVVMMSSLAAESVRMTGHIRKRIVDGQVGISLGKRIDAKIVVSRIPHHRTDVLAN